MKPLPEAVRAAFPCAPDRLPSRPWWRSAGHNNGKPAYRRSDDCDSPTGFQYDVMRFYSPEEVAVKHDSKNPLPHPGFRAGQVWADAVGDSVVVTHVRGGWVWLSEGDDAWSPTVFASVYPYLMADPACPWLAPWSPSEEKTP